MTEHSERRRWDVQLDQAVNKDVFISEVFKSLRSRILFPLNGTRAPRSIMVTSVLPGEGKSFVTANLGIHMAQGMDQYSLLVDCDLRRPVLADLFGLDISFGLADYLAGARDLSDLIIKSDVNKLSILGCGCPPSNPSELLSSLRMKDLVNELSSRYQDRLIIFDTPPVLVASESVVLARQVDAVLVVVREGKAARTDIRRTVNLIGKDRILGIVFNGQTTKIMEKTIIQHAANYYINSD